MPPRAGSSRQRSPRWGGIAGAAAVQLLVGWALVAGLSVPLPAPVERIVRTIALTPDAPAEPPPPPPERTARPAREEGRAAPSNLRARPVPVPRPQIPPPMVVPPPVMAAPVTADGAEADAGAADRPGSGTGAGGAGDGLGAGGEGAGTGGGGGGAPSEWIGGRIRDRDYPRGALMPGETAFLTTRYVVDTDGRIRRCEVVRPSGVPAIDDKTCALIIERFRFRPARDAEGRPVPDEVYHDHEWFRRER